MLAHTLIGPAMFSAAAQAAVRVAAHSGYASTDPFVLQESNNTVVWLRPHAVIAKVGKWPHSADALALEHAVATAISAAGAPIAPPLADVEPARDEDTGFLVTLWQRLEDTHRACPPAEVARALRELHEALPVYDGALPPFEATLLHAQAAALGDRMRGCPACRPAPCHSGVRTADSKVAAENTAGITWSSFDAPS